MSPERNRVRVDIRVVIDPATFDLSDHGSILGVIYLAGESWRFPDDRWSDFPVVILRWWLLELASEDRAELLFMDGPFAALLSGDRLTLTDGEKAVAEYSVDPLSLRAAVTDAAERVLGIAVERKWITRDVDELRRCLGRLTPGPK